MKYALLIYTSESEDAKMSEAEQRENMDAYYAFTTDLQQSGAFIAGEALLPTVMAKSVKVRDQKTLTTDGPFAETKEQLGGFYLVEAESEAAAIEWAAKIPGSHHGTVEVRPLMTFE